MAANASSLHDKNDILIIFVDVFNSSGHLIRRHVTVFGL